MSNALAILPELVAVDVQELDAPDAASERAWERCLRWQSRPRQISEAPRSIITLKENESR
jgi:hypothetical protein